MKKSGGKNFKSIIAYHGMAIIIAMIPLFVSLLLGFLHYGTRIRFHVPLLTDECVYWSQLDAMVHYGNPLGYFGYVGSKGAMGNWSTWGPGIIFPYFLFAKFFGLTFSTMYYANIFYLGLSIYLFIVITKLPIGRIPIVGAVVLLSPVLLSYSTSSMAESVRQAFGIIILALIYRMYHMETSKRYKYVIVPVIILLSMYTFVMHGLWLLIYFLFILKDTKFSVSLRFLLSIVFTGLLSVIVYVLTSIVSAPFYGGNLLSLSQKYAETGDIIETLRVFFRQTLGRLLSFDIVHLLQDMNFSKYLILAFWILLAVVAFRIFMKAEEFQRDELICIYTLASTYLIYLVVYTEYEGNLVRGLSIALVNCAFWMIAVNKKYFYALYILIFGLVGFTTFEETGIAYGTRSSYAEEIAYYEQTKEEITKALQIDPKKKGWENTIDVYSCDYQLDIMMPSGLGINQMWDDYVVEDSQAHWAAIYTDNVMNADFIALNYSIVYQNDLVTVYCYPAYADR